MCLEEDPEDRPSAAELIKSNSKLLETVKVIIEEEEFKSKYSECLNFKQGVKANDFEQLKTAFTDHNDDLLAQFYVFSEAIDESYEKYKERITGK